MLLRRAPLPVLCDSVSSEVFISTPLEQSSRWRGLSCHPAPRSCDQCPSFFPWEQQLDPPQKERLGAALAEMDQQLRRLAGAPWLCQPTEPSDEEVRGSRASARASLQRAVRGRGSRRVGLAALSGASPGSSVKTSSRRARLAGGRSWDVVSRPTLGDWGTCRPWRQNCALTRPWIERRLPHCGDTGQVNGSFLEVYF